MALIEIENLTKAYGLAPVLRKLNLTVERGEFIALLGHNGSGKSTLLRLLCALSKPTAGTIRVGGWELPKEAAAVRAQIGVVSHKPLLYENLTALENLRFFASLYGGRYDETIYMERLKRVGLSKRAHDLVRTFSRGMQQRLSLARATIHNPDILIMDEPYTGLDQDGNGLLDELLVQAHRDGRTILMATHDLDRAATLASRVVIIAKGTVGFDAPTTEMDGMQLAGHYRTITGAAVER